LIDRGSETCVVFLLGYPGVGKRTVGSHLAELLDGVLVDNQLINIPLLTLFKWDGKFLLPPEIWARVEPIREAVLGTIEDLAPSSNSYVFTNVLEDDEDGVSHYERIRLLAQRRRSLFLSVMLDCDVEEQVRRIDAPDRVARLKGSDPEGYRWHRRGGAHRDDERRPEAERRDDLRGAREPRFPAADDVAKRQHVPMETAAVRLCRDEADLEELFRSIGRQFGEEWDGADRRLEEPRSRFERDRDLMFALVDGTGMRGGVIAFGDDIVTIRAVGIDAELRGHGHGRRLLELVEARALVRGARTIVVGAADEARGFYDRMGYRGRGTRREKQLPPPGAVRTRLVKDAAASLKELPLVR
jgi:ribosomal protein S18 acetylase RimI-like enzyme